MTKSHVGIGFELCPVCAKKHNESILLDKRLKKSIEKDNFLGWNLCNEHKFQREKGFDFLVAIDESKSSLPYKLTNIYRTGSVIAVKTKVYQDIFNQKPPENGLSFCDEDSIKKLQGMLSGE